MPNAESASNSDVSQNHDLGTWEVTDTGASFITQDKSKINEMDSLNFFFCIYRKTCKLITCLNYSTRGRKRFVSEGDGGAIKK